MAYQKKATVLVLNCAPTMAVRTRQGSTAFQDALTVIQNLVHEKVLAGRKTDMTSIILAGTVETDNHLAEDDQYPHITTLTTIAQPTLDLLRRLVSLTVTETPKATADMLDALIVAIDLVKKHCGALKFEKKILLLTDGAHPIDWQDMDAVKDMLVENNIALVVIGTGFGTEIKLEDAEIKSEDGRSMVETIKNENQVHWKRLTDSVPQSDLISLSEALENAEAFHTKQVRPTPIFRDFLHLGDPNTQPDISLSISVNMFARTYEQRPEAFKKWSPMADLGSSTSTSTPTHEVLMVRKYRLKAADADIPQASNEEASQSTQEAAATTSDSTVVDEASLEKAYRFGKTLVKVSAQEEDYLRLQTQPGMWILGFVSEKAIQREYWLSRVYVVVAGSVKTEQAGVAIYALANALYDKGAVALVRYVSRKDAEPKLGILAPHIDLDISVLHFIQMPFSEDIRQFTFRSLDQVEMASGKVVRENHPLLPTNEMQTAMDTFVDNMDLMSVGKTSEGESCEYLVPEDTFNPVVWKYNESIKARALNEAAPVPETHPLLQAELQRVPSLVEKTADQVKEMQDLFKITKVEGQQAKRGYGVTRELDLPGAERAALPSVEDVLHSHHSTGEKKVKLEDEGSYEAAVESMMNKQEVRTITSVDPVADFRAMVENKKHDLVTEAVSQMGKMVVHLVTTSFGDQYYRKALNCLEAMRATAAKENEAGAFNDMMYQLKKECDLDNPASRRADFWALLQQHKLTLLSNADANDDEVAAITAEEAEKFLTEKRATDAQHPPPSKPADDADDMDTEDLLAMMD